MLKNKTQWLNIKENRNNRNNLSLNLKSPNFDGSGCPLSLNFGIVCQC